VLFTVAKLPDIHVAICKAIGSKPVAALARSAAALRNCQKWHKGKKKDAD
jgi:anaerobic ribonucleoside-triphosphate reductase